MCKLWTLQHFTRMNFESGKHSPTQLLSGFKLVANRDYGSLFEIIEKENSLSAWRAILCLLGERERVREFKNCLADNKRNVYMMLWNNEC
ncbi:hypothetical protein T03_1111 [Trichinella britovi]|uniref:Uncharacterized protein n=1 Tax=Trichinella britovi TaxID=45882 RepID=A0A0V1D7X8_TRIBR|nr:hypothetical protein T03_1111 [Trichinella britovi]